jgi:hypothetical protein
MLTTHELRYDLVDLMYTSGKGSGQHADNEGSWPSAYLYILNIDRRTSLAHSLDEDASWIGRCLYGKEGLGGWSIVGLLYGLGGRWYFVFLLGLIPLHFAAIHGNRKDKYAYTARAVFFQLSRVSFFHTVICNTCILRSKTTNSKPQ